MAESRGRKSGMDDRKIERMAVGHHDDGGVRRGGGQFPRGVPALDGPDVAGKDGRERSTTLVDPGKGKGEGGEGEHECPTDMPGSEQPDLLRPGPESFDDLDPSVGTLSVGSLSVGLRLGESSVPDGLDRSVAPQGSLAVLDRDPDHRAPADPGPGEKRTDLLLSSKRLDGAELPGDQHLGQHLDAAAAALAEFGPEGVAREGGGLGTLGKRPARSIENPPLELAAADGAGKARVAGTDDHPGAGLAGCGAAHRHYRDESADSVGVQKTGDP